jgi:hypothetical protein
MEAITKYIKNISPSSGVPIYKVRMGGIKKKFQINALNNAESKTGKISNRIALTETTKRKMGATALYPIMSNVK